MFRSLFVVALLGLVPAATAQIQIGARLGRHVSIGASFDHGSVGVRVFHGPAPVRGRHRGHLHGQRGHFETVTEQVWVPGVTRQVWVPDQYGWLTDACGRRHWGIVRPGYYETIQEPGCWRTVTRRVWVPHC